MRLEHVKRDDGRCIQADCQCGCALRLSSKDFADAVRLFAQAGSGPYSAIRLEPATAERRARVESEPTKRVECPKCEEFYEMADYLVDVLAERNAPAPICEGCRGGTQRTTAHWADGGGT